MAKNKGNNPGGMKDIPSAPVDPEQEGFLKEIADASERISGLIRSADAAS